MRDPPGRARARSRAASISSAKQVQPPDVSLSEPTPAGPGYGDQALAATVGLGRTLLSLSRGKGGEEKATRQSLPPLRPPRSVYSNPQSSPHTPVTPNQAVDTPPPSVELGTIVPDESRPPTVLLSRQNLGSFFQSTRSKLATATRFESDEPPLTDRYGFICTSRCSRAALTPRRYPARKHAQRRQPCGHASPDIANWTHSGATAA